MQYLAVSLQIVTATSLVLPVYLSTILVRGFNASSQQFQLMQSFSLLLLGAILSTLATLNFSLAFVVGILASPLSFVRPLPKLSSSSSRQITNEKRKHAIDVAVGVIAALLHATVSPPVMLYALSWYWRLDLEWTLVEIAKGWVAQGVYTSFVVWAVWWPAWVIGGVVLFSEMLRKQV